MTRKPDRRDVLAVVLAVVIGLAFVWVFIGLPHTVVHWLDDLRHELASTLSWEAVKTNLGAWPYQAVLTALIVTLLYPPVKKRVEAYIERKQAEAHQKRLKLEARAKAEREELGNMVQHLIHYHPDIPDYEIPPNPKEQHP